MQANLNHADAEEPKRAREDTSGDMQVTFPEPELHGIKTCMLSLCLWQTEVGMTCAG